MSTNDAFKSLGRALLGLAVLASFAFAAFGTVSILFFDGYYQFAVATAVCLVFAAVPMWRVVQKTLLL
jgi:hypothetical protein